MIFHYVDGALLCEVKIRGLTQTLPEYNELSSRFIGYYDPEDEDQWWRYDLDYPAYGGYRYFVCESLTRRAAQVIVDALGGYLVPERVPPSRQLGTGGPFHVHYFHVGGPIYVGWRPDVSEAIELASHKARWNCLWYRVYDNGGYMVAEFKG